MVANWLDARYDVRSTRGRLGVDAVMWRRRYGPHMSRRLAAIEWVRFSDATHRDVWLAALLVAAGQVEAFTVVHLSGARIVTASTMLLATVPLAFRRRFPVAVGVIQPVALALKEALGGHSELVVPLISGVIGRYSLGAYAGSRRSIAGLGASLVIGALAVALSPHRAPGDFAFAALAFVAPWLAGRALRKYRQQALALRELTRELDRDRDLDARLAVARERSRIARELHDVIAHSVSTMIVQAGAVQQVMKTRPRRAEEALEAIQSTGQEAIAELRRLLGILRESSDQPSLTPQPGVADLDSLAETTRRAGLPIELEIAGAPRPLPAGVDLCIYRVVQEALTNTLKHAGSARAHVRLSYAERSLQLEVLDDGDGACGAQGEGYGLIGMRERVALYGGELDAGRINGGGYRVRVKLPLDLSPR